MSREPQDLTEDDSMESNSSEKERLNPDDSQETVISEVGNKGEKPEPESAAKEGALDFDVRPADTYLGPDYNPKKPGGPKALWLGVLMVAVIIGLTYYAFRSQPASDPGYETTGEKTAAVVPGPTSDQQPPALPEKAPDAADFSPTPETEAAAVTASLPATASSSTPTTPVRDQGSPVSTTAKTTDDAKTGESKTAASTTKSVEPKPTTTTTKSAESKPTSTVTKAAEPKPTSTATKAAEPKLTATATKSAESKPVVTEATDTATKSVADSSVTGDTKAGEIKSDTPKPDATGTEGAATASEAEAKPALPETATATASPGTAAAAGEISDLWVVNISSTPDMTESNRLLNRVIATDVGGQVYFYETTIDGRVHHRIRVGFYKSRGEAEEVGQKVKDAFKLSATPWAVKPTVEEVEKYQKK